MLIYNEHKKVNVACVDVEVQAYFRSLKNKKKKRKKSIKKQKKGALHQIPHFHSKIHEACLCASQNPFLFK